MGCCLCRPVTDVEQDAAVTSYTDVGDVVFAYGFIVRRVQGCCCNGIMYIKGDSLYYEVKIGSTLCCTCYRVRFRLSEIIIVDIINDQSLGFLGGAIHLSPGLRITAQPNTTILVSMPDAAVFGPQLAEASNNQKRKDLERTGGSFETRTGGVSSEARTGGGSSEARTGGDTNEAGTKGSNDETKEEETAN